MISNQEIKKLCNTLYPYVITSGGQIVVQALGFMVGILIVRYLTTDEYAIYTLAITMQSTLSVLTDGGIGSGFFSEGGQVWNQPNKLGQVIRTGISLRRRFTFFSLMLTLPVFFILLQYHNISLWYTFAIVISIVPAFYLNLSGAFYEMALKLNQDLVHLHQIQLVTSILRVIIQFIVLLIFPISILILLVNGIVQYFSTQNLKKRALSFADLSVSSNNELKSRMLKLVIRTLPGTIYFSFSSQITNWLISIFGTTTNIAQLGALGRFSMVFNLFASVFAIVVLSKFSKLPFHSKLITKNFLLILFSLVLFNLVILGFVWVFSTQLLAILGPNYSALTSELFLSILAGTIGLISNSTFSLLSVKSWFINPFIFIPLSILSIVIGIFLCDVSTLTGVLYLNIFVNLVQLIVYLYFGLFKIRELKKLELY